MINEHKVFINDGHRLGENSRSGNYVFLGPVPSPRIDVTQGSDNQTGLWTYDAMETTVFKYDTYNGVVKDVSVTLRGDGTSHNISYVIDPDNKSITFSSERLLDAGPGSNLQTYFLYIADIKITDDKGNVTTKRMSVTIKNSWGYIEVPYYEEGGVPPRTHAEYYVKDKDVALRNVEVVHVDIDGTTQPGMLNNGPAIYVDAEHGAVISDYDTYNGFTYTTLPCYRQGNLASTTYKIHDGDMYLTNSNGTLGPKLAVWRVLTYRNDVVSTDAINLGKFPMDHLIVEEVDNA